jgi:CO/xanthine dehydrogenase Mo-binding subunit
MTTTVVHPRIRGSEPVRMLAPPALYRGLLATADTFARESDLDQRAYLAGVDPVDFRLDLLEDERLAMVIVAAARRFGWQAQWYPAGGPASWAKGGLRRGAGVAGGLEAGYRVATCAEVCLGGDAAARVSRVVTAYGRGAAGDVVLVDRPGLPSAGVGVPLAALAPAIANAIFAATGQRLPALPPHAIARLAWHLRPGGASQRAVNN